MSELQEIRDGLAALLARLDTVLASEAPTLPPPPPEQPTEPSDQPLAWGAKVSPTFRDRVRLTGKDFSLDPNWLMACMAFETGRTFSPSVKNPRSSATGLIQFMEATAQQYGTSTAALARMTAEEQFNFVWLYFRDTIAAHGTLKTLSDCYMAILWPRAIGMSEDAIIFPPGTSTYAANAGLDANRDHAVTKAEAAARVAAMLTEGLKPENAA